MARNPFTVPAALALIAAVTYLIWQHPNWIGLDAASAFTVSWRLAVVLALAVGVGMFGDPLVPLDSCWPLLLGLGVWPFSPAVDYWADPSPIRLFDLPWWTSTWFKFIVAACVTTLSFWLKWLKWLKSR